MNSKKSLVLIAALVFALGTAVFAQSIPATGKTGQFTITKDTQVGNAVLAPGSYEARYRNSGNGHYVEFTKVTVNAGDTGLSPYEYDVVAKVPCEMEHLQAQAPRTELLKAGQTARLEIRGEDMVHIF